MFSCSQTPQIEILCASKTNLKFNFLKQFKSTLYFVLCMDKNLVRKNVVFLVTSL